MKHTVIVESWKKQALRQLPDGWSDTDYQVLLEMLDVSDAPQEECRGYVLLALSDLERPEAAEIILTYLLSDQLTEGQIQHLAHELEDEKLWEEYAGIALHKFFFQAAELLYEAFNGGFPIPKAQQITAIIRPVSPTTAEDLNNLSSTAMLRLLALGFDEQSLMIRLFEEQLKRAAFPEAEGIIWKRAIRMITPDTFELTVISSEYWLEDFTGPKKFESTFAAD